LPPPPLCPTKVIAFNVYLEVAVQRMSFGMHSMQTTADDGDTESLPS